MTVSEKTTKPAKELVVGQIMADRLELLELTRQLRPEEWEQPSLCEGWRVRDVVAHIIGGQKDLGAYLTSGGLNKANQKMVEKRRHLSTDELIEQLNEMKEP